MRSMMGVFAHPDDESFGPGGTLARYAAEGVAVDVLIATDGIAGSVEESSEAAARGDLAQVRSRELANAATALGVRSVWSLPFRDSGMRGSPENQNPGALIQQPMERLVAEVLGHMRRLRPQVVITHDLWGGYGHPDHIRVSEAVTAAFYLAETPRKLYYTAMPKAFLRVMTWVMPLYGADPSAIGRNKDINLVEISRWNTPVNARIDTRAWMSVKEAASRAHVSQYSGGPSWAERLPMPIRRRVLGAEVFTRAFPPANGEVERDLFAGL